MQTLIYKACDRQKKRLSIVLPHKSTLQDAAVVVMVVLMAGVAPAGGGCGCKSNNIKEASVGTFPENSISLN